MSEQNDGNFSIPALVANHLDLIGASYKDGMLSIKNQVSFPVAEHIGQEAVDLIEQIALADDDRMFSKNELIAVAIAAGRLAMKGSPLAKHL